MLRILDHKLLMALILLFFSACQQNAKKSESSEEVEEIGASEELQELDESASKQTALQNFSKAFEGDIAEEYPIIANIASDSGQLTGVYYYTKIGKEIELQGNLNSNNEVVLQEFDPDGNQTGLFEGNYENGTIEGVWKKPNGTNILTFKLTESKLDYTGHRKQLAVKQNYTGNYVSTRSNKEDNSTGTLYVNKIDKTLYEFVIHVAHPRGVCTGNLAGNFKMGTDGVALFKTSGCEELRFEFMDEEIKVTEKGCDGFHGAYCNFNGTYVMSKDESLESAKNPILYSNVNTDHITKDGLRYEVDLGWGRLNFDINTAPRKDYFYRVEKFKTVLLDPRMSYRLMNLNDPCFPECNLNLMVLDDGHKQKVRNLYKSSIVEEKITDMYDEEKSVYSINHMNTKTEKLFMTTMDYSTSSNPLKESSSMVVETPPDWMNLSAIPTPIYLSDKNIKLYLLYPGLNIYLAHVTGKGWYETRDESKFGPSREVSWHGVYIIDKEQMSIVTPVDFNNQYYYGDDFSFVGSIKLNGDEIPELIFGRPEVTLILESYKNGYRSYGFPYHYPGD